MRYRKNLGKELKRAGQHLDGEDHASKKETRPTEKIFYRISLLKYNDERSRQHSDGEKSCESQYKYQQGDQRTAQRNLKVKENCTKNQYACGAEKRANK